MRVAFLLIGAVVFAVIFAVGLVTFVQGYTHPVLPPPERDPNEENPDDV